MKHFVLHHFLFQLGRHQLFFYLLFPLLFYLLFYLLFSFLPTFLPSFPSSLLYCLLYCFLYSLLSFALSSRQLPLFLLMILILLVNQALHQWFPFYSLSINQDRKSTRLNSSHVAISYAVF